MPSEFQTKIDAFVEDYPGFTCISHSPEMKRQAADALALSIKAYTWEGKFEIDTEITPEHLVRWLDEIQASRLPGNLHYRKTDGEVRELDAFVAEDASDYLCDVEAGIRRDIEDRYYSHLEADGLYHLVADLKEQEDFSFALMEQGILDFSVKVMDDAWKCNILLAHGDEANSDFSNSWVLGSMLNGVWENEPSCVHDNALAWLVHQQGYTLKDLVEGESSPFLDSVRQELENTTSSMSALTLCVRLDRKELESMLDPSHNIRIDKGVLLGLFDPWAGGGASLDIVLEKDLIFDSRMIHTIQVEGAKRYGQYNVDSVYGLVDRAWRRACSPTDEVVSFPDEAEKRTDLEALKAYCDAQAEAQDQTPGCR